MPARTLPGIGLVGGRSPGEDGWSAEMNSNLLRLSSLVHLTVASRTSALPGSPTDGMIYIVPAADGTNPNKVAVRDNGAWVYVTAIAGMRARVVDTSTWAWFNGTAWADEPQPYDLAMYIPGTPDANAEVVRTLAGRAFTLPAGLTGSAGYAKTAPSANTTLTIKKGATAVGSITVNSGANAATLAMASTTAFAAGDVLVIETPAALNSLADISITLVGSR